MNNHLGANPASARPGFTLAWQAPNFVSVKGIVHTPGADPAMKPDNRDALLTAFGKARRWMDDIRRGRVASFAEIAARESRGEPYVRRLASLAFVSPRIIAAIIDGTAPANLTVTRLARDLADSWSEQHRNIGLRQ